MLGAWLSTTITCWVQLLELPCTSVTIQTTALVPTGYGSLPSLITVLTPQLSLVLAGTRGTTVVAPHAWLSSLTVASAQLLLGGFSLSTTYTFWELVAV